MFKVPYHNPIHQIGLQFFGMQSLDSKAQARQAVLQQMADAIKANNTEDFTAAFNSLAEQIADDVRADFQEVQAQQDAAVLAARGCRTLTSQEKTFYENLLTAMKSENPKQGLTKENAVLPETVIDSVFEDITTGHPLMEAIDMQNTGALVKILLSTTGGVAKWGALGAPTDSELSANFIEVDLTAASLTAYIPVNKHMIHMGPEWMDRYVRTVLKEAIATQLEVGIVAGTGKEQPIGMDKKLTGASDGVYQKKTPVKVTDLSPESYGKILDTLSKGPSDKARNITEVLLIVNPSDYYTKIFPATTIRGADGTYVSNAYPFPTKTIPSAAVTKGEAIMGLGKKYFLGIGGGTEGGRIEYSDEVRFLERQRVYLAVLYGYGRALDENAFVLLDISTLSPASKEVVVQDIKQGTVTTQAGA